MKFKKLLCCILSALMITVPLMSGCKHVDGKDFDIVPNSSAQNSANRNSSADTSEDTEYTGAQITPAMWKATDESGNYIYMLGSIHVADNAVRHMPDYFEKAFEECDTLSFEIDLSSLTDDLLSNTELIYDMMYSDGTTIKDHISKELYNGLVQVLTDNNSYSPLYDYYKPLMWESLLENVVAQKSGLDSNKSVDMVLTERAKQSGKEILEVESFEFQMNMFNNFSDELIEMILEVYTEENAIEEQSKQLKELYEKWKTGTVTYEDTNDNTALEELTEEQKELLEEYNTEMLIDRNEKMAESVKEYMQSGKTVMLVVGMAHFLGDDGILKLLEDDGITITRLSDNSEETSVLQAA